MTHDHSFRYYRCIDGIADYFGHRSNSIASTYLLGMQSRSDISAYSFMVGNKVILCRSDGHIPIGLPMPQNIFEQLSFNIKLLYSGDKILVGEITEQKHDEFVVASANFIGYNLYFSVINGGADERQSV